LAQPGSLVMCPYCAVRGDRHLFLTEAQERYVDQYCQRLRQALEAEEDGKHVIGRRRRRHGQ
jgi:hypothetical protein